MRRDRVAQSSPGIRDSVALKRYSSYASYKKYDAQIDRSPATASRSAFLDPATPPIHTQIANRRIVGVLHSEFACSEWIAGFVCCVYLLYAVPIPIMVNQSAPLFNLRFAGVCLEYGGDVLGWECPMYTEGGRRGANRPSSTTRSQLR